MSELLASPGSLEADAAAIARVAGEVETPAFVLSEPAILAAMAQVAAVQGEAGCKVLYALKPLGHLDALRWMVGHVDGMAASSLYEARLAREVLGKEGTVSITSPGLRLDESEELASYCDHIVCNSLPQYERFQRAVGSRCALGLRVNPQLSFVQDERYDPCHAGSKLGMPLTQLVELLVHLLVGDGDVGHLDPDGYLYLTDRKSHMIISGGVNIYPQEVENCLAAHPRIDDVAVIGVPNDDMGEEVKGVVQLAPGVEPSPELERELIAYVREHIAHYKAPRSIDFVSELPRLENGKIYKRMLRDRYWSGRGSRLV